MYSKPSIVHIELSTFNALVFKFLIGFLIVLTSSVSAQSPRTVAFTGNVSDFTAAELSSASSSNVNYYMTYDANTIYIGAFATSGSFNANDNFTIYLDTDPQMTLSAGTGTTSGQLYNGVTGTLPFTANYNVHVEQNYQEARSFGSTWASTITGPTYFTSSTCREVAIPKSAIGSPYGIYLSMWMGYSNGIFANAPGASLGNGANPTVVNYFGGIGLSAADCTPLATQNLPIIDVVTDAVPANGDVLAALRITGGSYAVNNNFTVAPGGCIQVTGGNLNLANTEIDFGGSSAGSGKGTLIEIAGGTVITGASTEFEVNGELQLLGDAQSFQNNWVVRNKLTFLSDGGTTIGSSGILDIRTGGYLNGNAPTYASGSTLSYNTGGVFVAGAEWASGSASGVGVPFNVTIGDAVANSALSFGTSSSYRRCSNNITVANFGTTGLTLSSVSGGDLHIGGSITQNGTFTHNNRAVVFNGSTTQNITGNFSSTGATNNFAFLVVATTNTGGVVLNSNTVISGASGNVLEMNAIGRLNIGTGVNLNFINAGGNILVSGGTRNIRFNAGNSTVTFSAAKTVTNASGGVLSFTALVNGASIVLTQGVNFGSNMTTIGNGVFLRIDNGGFVNTNAPVYTTGSTLQYNTGATYGRGAEWSATSGAGYPHHVLISTSGTSLNLGNGGTAVARQMAGDLTINNGCALNMSTTAMTAALSVLGNITIGGGTSGALVLSTSGGGNLNVGGNITQSAGATLTHNNRSITLNGTANQNISVTTTLFDLTLNNALGATLSAPLTVSNVLTLSNGNLTLGSNNLTLTSSAAGAIAGTFSNTRMILASGTGQVIRAIATGGLPINYVWPIGDNIGTTEYSPIALNITANNTARNIGFNVTHSAHPQVNNSPTQTDFISRFWTVSNSAGGTYTYTASATYPAADLTGTASNIRLNIYNSSAWVQDPGSSSASNVLTSTTGLTSANFPLNTGFAITGRVNNGTTYVWNQTGTANFTTAANWTPNRTTQRLDDILVFNNGATTTATNVPNQGIGQLLISGNTNVTFTTTAGNTLTIRGGNGVDFNIASGSTLVLGSTAANSLVIAHANAVTTTIGGTLTINGNTSNNNGINFTNTTAQVTGTVNNFGVITSTAANLNFNAGSFYNHNFTTTVGTIPTATWNVTSTCRIQGYTSGGGANFTPLGLSQTFGNFTWNCSGQSEDAQLNGNLTAIAGNFTVSETNGNDLKLTNNTGYTLNIGGNLNLSDNNTTLRLTDGDGNAVVNVAGSYTQTNTSELRMNEGNNNISSKLFVAGNFSLGTGGLIDQGSGGTNDNLIEWNGTTAQTVTINGTLPVAGEQMNYRLNNSAGMNLTGTIPVNASSIFYRRAGAITGGTITYNATSGSLVYESIESMTTGIEWPTTNGPVNVTMNGTAVVNLAGARTLPATGVFTNISGVLSLGANNLTLSNTGAGAIVNASPSSTNMIATSGTGQLRLTLPNSARVLNFFIGDLTGTPEYGGMRLDFTANSLNNRIVGVRVIDDTSAVLSQPYAPIDYLTRHWIVTLSSNSGSYSYIPTLTYDVPGDVEGTENNLQVAAWPSGASSWNHYATTITSPSLTKNAPALTNTNFNLNNAIFTGRTPVKYWDGSISSSWNVAGNWTPSGVPAATENIDVNGNAINPLVLTGTATVNHFTFSDGGNFTLGASGNLTVAGNLTFSPNATASFNCGSTLNLTNTTFNQTIPAIQYGNLNLGTGARTLASSDTISICGNYTPTTGTLVTTGSTVEFNGTAAQTIQTNPTSFNVVLINNTAASVSSGVNVAVNGALQIPAAARLNITGGTWTIAAGAIGSVHGFLRNAGTVTTTGTLTFQPTGVYEHFYTNNQGTVPASTWTAGSICRFMGYTSNGNAPAGIGQAFHHVEWNCPSQSSNINLDGGLNNINGNFTIASTGTAQLRLSGTNAASISIVGDFIQTGGSLRVKSGNNNQTILTIGGNFSQTGGSLDGNSGDSGFTELRLSGNFSRTGNGSITTSGNTTINTLFLFQGNTQSILQTTTGAASYCDYHIASGSTTTLLSNFALNSAGASSFPVRFDVRSGAVLNCGTFEVSGFTGVGTSTRVLSGATIRTAHASGLNASGLVGSIQTDNREYNSGASYVFNGAVNQNTGNFWTITSTPNTVANLTIDNTANAVAMNSGTNVNVTNNLTFSSANSAYLNVASNTITVTNSALGAVVRNSVGHVVGNLGRAIIPSASNTYIFHVGTTTTYSPVVSTLNMGAGAGSIVARATDGSHPNMATNGLSQTSLCNRYWTLTNSGATVNSASHQLNYVSGDLIGGATDDLLVLGRFAGTWSFPTYTTSTNNITGTSLNNTSGFGDFFAAVGCSSYVADITAGGATTFCDGGTVNLSASANITGSIFAWSPSTGLDATTGSSVNASPATTTTYTVTATSPQNCVDTETITITVNPFPAAAGIITGTATVCQGQTGVVFSVPAIANATGYVWNLPTGASITAGANTNSITVNFSTTASSGVVTVRGNNACGVGTLSANYAVTVNPLPAAAGTITGTATVCQGQNAVSFTVSAIANATGYTWTLPTGATIASGANTNSITVNFANTAVSGNITVRGTNACGNGTISANFAVTVNPLPAAAGSITGTAAVCPGESGVSYSVPAIANATGYVWTLPTGATIASGNNTNSIIVDFSMSAVTGVITVQGTNACGNGSVSANFALNVNPMPSATVSGPNNACNGASANFVISGNANSAVYYTMNGGPTFSILTNGAGLAYVEQTITAATTLQLVSIEGDFCTASLSGSWTIQPTALSASVSGSTALCAGQSSTIVFNGTPNATLGYQINGGAVQTIVLNGSGSASLSTGALFNSSTYSLSYVQSGACNYAASGSAVVSVVEMPDATFIGGGAVCGGSVQTIQVVGTPSTTVSYTINGGAAQNILLNGSGNGTITTAPIAGTTVYNLVTASVGSCSNSIGVQVTFTVIGSTFYQDADGDGFGNPSVSQIACTAPVGYVADNTDCNDGNNALNPATDWYADMDGDGYGGFIFMTQCDDPGVPGVVSQGGDCDDSNPLIFGGAAEICGNNIDDNCNGLIDEGCFAVGNDTIVFATNVIGSVTSYPFTIAINGTLVGASNSPESNAFSGRDRWYRFQAGSTAARIVLNTTSFDGGLQLCNASFAPIAGAFENANNAVGNEIMIETNLTIGQWYYIGVCGVTASDVGSFTLNIQHFYPSGCGTSTAQQLNACTAFKARANGASSYTYVFTPVVTGMGGGSFTVNGPVTLSNPALGLIPGQSYQVSVTATFSGLVNGIGQPEANVVLNAPSACLLTLAPHDNIQVRNTQRCEVPAVLLRSTILRTDPFVCGVTNYTYEFTPTSGCANYAGTGLPFTHTNVSRNIPLNFTGATTSPLGQTIQPQSYYIVRVRPNFGVGGTNPGTWGTPRIIYIGGTLMTEYTDEEEQPMLTETVVAADVEVYPNPGNGSIIQLASSDMNGEVRIELFDQFGRLVAQNVVFAESGLQMQWQMDQPLANGLYHIRVLNDGQWIDKKYLVTR